MAKANPVKLKPITAALPVKGGNAPVIIGTTHQPGTSAATTSIPTPQGTLTAKAGLNKYRVTIPYLGISGTYMAADEDSAFVLFAAANGITDCDFVVEVLDIT